MATPDYEVLGLVRERTAFKFNNDGAGTRLVDEQLRVRGWQVDGDGNLEPYAAAPKREKRPAAKAPETREA